MTPNMLFSKSKERTESCKYTWQLPSPLPLSSTRTYNTNLNKASYWGQMTDNQKRPTMEHIQYTEHVFMYRFMGWQVYCRGIYLSRSLRWSEKASSKEGMSPFVLGTCCISKVSKQQNLRHNTDLQGNTCKLMKIRQRMSFLIIDGELEMQVLNFYFLDWWVTNSLLNVKMGLALRWEVKLQKLSHRTVKMEHSSAFALIGKTITQNSKNGAWLSICIDRNRHTIKPWASTR